MLVLSVQRPRRSLKWRKLKAWRESCPPKRRSWSFFFAKIAMQLVNREAKKEVENIIRLISDGNFDEG